MRSGFILLWRDTLERELFREKPFCPFGAWAWLIMEANFEDKPDRFGDIVKRGELHTSQPALAEVWGWSRSKVQRFLTRLEAEQRIEQEADKRRTKIRVTNYESYQNIKGKPRQGSNKEPDKEPDKQAGTTERSTTQQRINSIRESLRAVEPEVCESQEFTPEQFRAQIQQMADYLANAKRTYRDLAAFARNWLRRDWNKPKTAPLDFMERREKRQDEAVEKAKAMRAAQDALFAGKPKQPRIGGPR